MNATKWETLTNFVKYLGKSGQCVVDETEKGWYIAWVDRDPAALARQAAMDKKRKHEMDDEERARRELKRQVKAAGGVKEVQADAVDLSKGVSSFGLAAAEKPPTVAPKRLAAFRSDSPTRSSKLLPRKRAPWTRSCAKISPRNRRSSASRTGSTMASWSNA